MSGRVLVVKNIEREGLGLMRDVLHVNDVEADVVEVARGDRDSIARAVFGDNCPGRLV